MTEKALKLYEAIEAMARVNNNTLMIKYLNELVEELTDTPELIKGVREALGNLTTR